MVYSDTTLELVSNPLKTHADLLAALHTLLKPLDACTSPGGARVTVGYTSAHFDEAAAHFEGYARRLWGAVPAALGVPDGQDEIDWAAYRKGITSGVDPQHPEYWGESIEHDQRYVEMAPVGFALAIIPEKIWTPLSEKTKRQLQEWLLIINPKLNAHNNWHFFRVFVNLGLARVGAEHSTNLMYESLDRSEAWYLGDGWYSDGSTQQRDYYITFAIHYYSLIYAAIVSRPELANTSLADPKRAQLYRSRASLIANDFLHWFDPESGASIPFGRSLTYRFAVASFWGALAFAEVELPEGLTWGILKGVYLRNLRWWFQKPEIFNADGTLSLGWAYPNLNMAEGYNSPGSPYWALKAFIPLALPPSHPFWTSTPEAPIPKLPSPYPIPQAHMIIVHSTRSPSHTYMLASGQYAHWPMRHSADKYGKLAYSATFGFSVPIGAFGLEQVVPDNTLALSDDAERTSGNGNHWRVRRTPLDAKIVRDGTDVAITARWDAWEDVDIRTWVVPLTTPSQGSGDWHLRIHRIVTGRQLWAADCGFSVYGQSSQPPHRLMTTWNDELDEGAELRHKDEASALVRSSIGVSGIKPFKWSPPAEDSQSTVVDVTPRIITCGPNSSLMFSKSVMPTLVHKLLPRSEPYWLVTGVFAVAGHVRTDNWRSSWEATESIGVPDWLLKHLVEQ